MSTVALIVVTAMALCFGITPNASAANAVFDDFTGPAGTKPNPGLWKYQLGAGGLDGQLQAHTDDPRNASLDGNGNLAITAFNEPVPIPWVGVAPYSSALLNTHNHLDFTYGTVSARIKFPAQQGIHSAFWLLGSDFESVGWPQAGEIDVMEVANNGLSGSTLHGPTGYALPVSSPFDVSDGWHTYWTRWERDKIVTGIDETQVAAWTPESLPPGTPWTFNDRPMYVVLNMNVSGPAGAPDGSTRFPVTMLVDSFRYTP